MEKRKIIFLTEGSSSMGFGHVTRCLALSQAFLEHGFQSLFYVHGDDSIGSVLGHVEHRVFNWLNGIGDIKFDLYGAIIILDTFSISEELLGELSNISKITILDDFIRREHHSRLIIDWTINAEKKFYLNKNLSSTYLLGHEYISLRRPFWDRKSFIVNSKIKNVLIMFGSGDIRNLCARTACLIREIDWCIRKTIIIGGASTSRSVVESLADPMTKIIVDANDEQVFSLMKNADLAIASGGQTLYELACVGVPTISVMLIDNQLDDINGWSEVGFTYHAGQWDDVDLDIKILNRFNELRGPRTRFERSLIGQSLVDGQGARRIVKNILRENYDC